MKENQEIIITIGKMNVIGITEGITQKTYIPIVDLCKYLGINSNMQIKKIKSEYIFKDNIKMLPMQTNVGIKNKFCLEIRSLPFYLINIDESKCREEIFKKIIDLQLASMKILENSSITKDFFNVDSNYIEKRILELEDLIIKSYKDDSLENEPISNNKIFFDFSTISKMFEISESELIQLCKDFGLLNENNLPKQEYIDKQLFKVSLENIGFAKSALQNL